MKLVRAFSPFATSFVVGFVFILGVVFVFAMSEQYVLSLRRSMGYSDDEWINVTATGEPIISRRTSKDTQYFHLDRTTAPAPTKIVSPVITAPASRLTGHALSDFGTIYPVMGHWTENWYFVLHGGKSGEGWFEGYDPATRRRLGYIGVAGFRNSPPERDERFKCGRRHRPFTEREDRANFLEHDQALLAANGSLYLIDFAERSSTEILKDIGDAGITVTDRDVVLRRSATIQFIDYDSRETKTYTLPADLPEKVSSVYLLPSGEAIAQIVTHGNELFDAARQEIIHEFVWFAADGKATRRESASLRPQGQTEFLDQETALNLFVGATGSPAVAAPILFNSFWRIETTLSEKFMLMWPSLFFVSVLTLFLAFGAARWQTKHRLPRSYGWIAFVLLFGLPGYIGYRLHRRWPVHNPAPPPTRLASDIFA